MVCAAAPLALGQTISGGVIGGTHFTKSFVPRFSTSPADAFNPANEFRFESGPRSFIGGVTLEGRLNDAFSIEANVLHKPLKRTITFTEIFPDGTRVTDRSSATAVRTWVFPVLLKYSFEPVQIAKARPFFTIGPSFRTQEDASAAEPSQLGLTIGAGFTVPMGRLRLAPTLRYTRWRGESIAPRYATKPDQLEILGSLSYETDAQGRRFAGRHLEIGALLGLGLVSGFDRGRPGYPDNENLRYVAGLTARVDVNERLALEMDGIYKPLRAVDRIRAETPDGQVIESEHPFSVITWQFPLLAKYRLVKRGYMPFVAGGPSFRLSGNLNGYQPSRFGVTGSFGVETRVGVARWSSELRYTRWKQDEGRIRTNPNALELVIGMSF